MGPRSQSTRFQVKMITQVNFDIFFPMAPCSKVRMCSWLLTFIAAGASGFLTQPSTDYASPLVFDAAFYVNNNNDLHVFHSARDARDHWLRHGIDEGRQAAGNFHTVQYLQRYADLSKVYGKNYKAAVQHYLMFGIKEHRMGYLEGGAQGRYTISDGRELFISSSDRTAGAVDSLVWRNKEFINAWDHGRELQMAANAPPYVECFNPTEAGGAADGTGTATKSQLKGISVQGRVMKTTVHPAFWIRHNDVEHGPGGGQCHKGSHAVNTVDTYLHPLAKQVDIGCVGMDTCIRFMSSFTIAGTWPDYQFINFEAPTGYLSGDFTVVKNFNPATNQLQAHSSNSLPPVLTTPDDKYAMGVWAPAGQDSDRPMYYATWNFGGDFAGKTNKWNVVFRKNHLPSGTTHVFNYVAYICVGNSSMVESCLSKVHKAFPHV